jgi:hypothetical protein
VALDCSTTPTCPALITDVIYVVMSSSAAKKPVYLRGLPSDVVRDAKAAAAKRGVTLAGFVAETLARALRQRDTSAESTADLNAEMRWYQRNRERLAREYAGQYIAIVEGKVVDHDASFEPLAERVFAREGARNIFMPLVGAPKKPVHVPSPRKPRSR